MADSELELIPRKIASLPAIRRDAEKRKKKAEELLLDSSLHHSAMKGLGEEKRRGRPDIVHISLLIANESILNREGMLEMVVHTRNNEAIKISPEMKVIKNCNRFKGLMEQLLKEGEVPPGKPLMRIERKNMTEIVNEMNADKIILLSEQGEAKPLEDTLTKNSVCIIGGFPHGEFISPVEEIADEVIAIYPSPLPAWIALMEAIVAYERKFVKRYL